MNANWSNGSYRTPETLYCLWYIGQIQHIAGMQESSIIISVNNDPAAPINSIADYVITGTVEEVIPKMIKYYNRTRSKKLWLIFI
jgi:NAD-dependent SIR2 family protein deacetylase